MTAAGLEAAHIPIGDEQLLGGFYRPAAEGPRPAVALVHGIPGHERNLDLAQVLRAAGLHCLYFHFRGSWGSDGVYRMPQLVPDTLAALAWLSQRADVDSSRIGLVGISLGGWAALACAAENEAVRAVAALSPLVDPAARPLQHTEAAEFARSLRGTDASRLQREWGQLTPLTSMTTALKQRPTLLVSGDRDEFFAPDHYRALAAALPELRWARFPRADHVFSSVRPGLCHLVRDFLLKAL